MANIFVSLEHGIEVAATDVLHFLTASQAVTTKAEPGVIAALGVLLGTLEQSFVDVTGVVAQPLNVSIDAATVTDLRSVWPAVKEFAQSLGIKL